MDISDELASLSSLDPNERFTRPDLAVSYIKAHARKGDPQSILDVTDDFCSKYAKRSMHIGPKKGKIIDDIIKECKPTVALELGAFWGYSAVRFARLLEPGSTYYSIEVNPEFVALAKEVVEFAGLSDRVVFIEGGSEEVIPQLKEKYNVDKVDFALIDHWKTLYKPDIIRLENHGVFKKGTVIVADNVIVPGAPDYLEYVRNSPNFKSTFFECAFTYNSEVIDGLEKSIYLG